ncbi:MAG: ribosomal protein S18-alanine N-acetyltransferase [Oscillospiraceae bacterium]|jgi:ribosomal-protein-alanine N-acetyltransferase|nr:ribosomal protein S18-alanine N-acetyltransferase [Oscillospiraceae bacterium]
MLTTIPCELSHIPRILEIERASFDDPWTERMFTDELKNPRGYYLAALDGDNIIGFAGMFYLLGEGEIRNIAVAPEARKRGVASALLNAIEAKAMEVNLSGITLEVRVSNQPAIELYSKLGYKSLGIRPGYYIKPREDAIIMIKNIKRMNKV